MANPVTLSDTSWNGLLKNVYENYRVKLFPRLTPLMAQLQRGKAGGPERMRWGGNGVYWDVVVTRPVGGTFNDGGYFPPSTVATEKQANIGVKRNYVTREIDKLAVHAARGSETSFASLMQKITEEAMDAGKLSQQEALHGDGSGIKALVVSRTSSTVVVVASPYGVSGAGRGHLLLGEGMSIVAYQSGTILTTTTVPTISSITVSGDNATVTFSSSIEGAGTIGAGDKLYAASTISQDSKDQLPDGLIKISDRGSGYATVCGLSRTTYPRLTPVLLAAGTDTPDASQITEMDIQKLITKVAMRTGKDPLNSPGEFLLLTTPGMQIALADSLLGQRRFETKLDLQGGYKALEVCGLPCITDPWCPAGTVYLIHRPSLAFVDAMDFVKLTFEDSGAFRFISGQDAYQVNFGAYWNLATLNRTAAVASITGYTDTSRYDFAA